MKAQLRDTETSCHSAKRGDRHEYGLGIRQVKFNALHYLGKSEVTPSIISNDVYQHRLPPRSIGMRSTNSCPNAGNRAWP